MQTFSPSEAAFEGFRVIRSHPGAVLAWAVAYMLCYLVLGGIALMAFGPQIAAMSSYSGSTPMPPDVAFGFFRSMGVAFLILLPVGLFIGAMLVNAAYRPILRPDDRGFFYLKLGGDEGRLVLLFLAYFGLGILAEIVLVIVVVILALLFHTAVQSLQGAQILIPLLLGLAVFCLGVWLAVRLSLAAPMTFARRKLSVFGSWEVTRGRFWSLFGCYILAWIFGILIGLFGWIVSVCAGAVISGDWGSLSSHMFNPRMAMAGGGLSMVSHMFTLAAIVQIVLSSLIGAVSRVVMYAPMAAAYRDLGAPSDTADSPWAPKTSGLVL